MAWRIRDVLVRVVVLAMCGSAWAQEPPSAPPPPRTFGPDSTATNVYTGQGTATPGLACDDPVTPQTCAGFLASALDGTLLEATVRIPPTAGAHPLVVIMHGWGGSESSTAKYDDRLLAEGLAVLRYSARGFGGSWGQTNLADVNVEGANLADSTPAADLRSMIAQVADQLEPVIDPSHVAVFGASYGGAHAWLAALVPQFKTPAGQTVVIRTVVPIASWSDLLNGLVPNGGPDRAHEVAGAEKLLFTEGLFLGGIRTRPDRPYLNYPGYLFEWNLFLTLNELPYGATSLGTKLVDGTQGYRSMYWQESFWSALATAAPHVPVFAIQGWTDDLFPAREALRMYEALRSVDPSYPIALYLGDVGHPRAANKSGEVAYVLDQVVAWLDWFLKGTGAQPPFDVQAAITRPAGVQFDRRDVIRSPTFAGLWTRVATAAFSATNVITFNPLNTSGFAWDPFVITECTFDQSCPAPESDVLPGDVAVYNVKVSKLSGGGRLTIAGEPAVSLYALTFAYRIQLDVRVFDVAPNGSRSLVTRGTLTLDSGSPTSPLGFRRVRIPTFGNLWEAPSGHTLRLEVTNVDSPYLRPSLVPSITLIGDVRLSIPVRDR